MPNFDLDTALEAKPHEFEWSIPVHDAMHMVPARGLSLAEHLTDLSSEQEGFTEEIRNSAWTAEVYVEAKRGTHGTVGIPCFYIVVTQGDPL